MYLFIAQHNANDSLTQLVVANDTISTDREAAEITKVANRIVHCCFAMITS